MPLQSNMMSSNRCILSLVPRRGKVERALSSFLRRGTRLMHSGTLIQQESLLHHLLQCIVTVLECMELLWNRVDQRDTMLIYIVQGRNAKRQEQ